MSEKEVRKVLRVSGALVGGLVEISDGHIEKETQGHGSKNFERLGIGFPGVVECLKNPFEGVRDDCVHKISCVGSGV